MTTVKLLVAIGLMVSVAVPPTLAGKRTTAPFERYECTLSIQYERFQRLTDQSKRKFRTWKECFRAAVRLARKTTDFFDDDQRDSRECIWEFEQPGFNPKGKVNRFTRLGNPQKGDQTQTPDDLVDAPGGIEELFSQVLEANLRKRYEFDRKIPLPDFLTAFQQEGRVTDFSYSVRESSEARKNALLLQLTKYRPNVSEEKRKALDQTTDKLKQLLKRDYFAVPETTYSIPFYLRLVPARNDIVAHEIPSVELAELQILSAGDKVSTDLEVVPPEAIAEGLQELFDHPFFDELYMEEGAKIEIQSIIYNWSWHTQTEIAKSTGMDDYLADRQLAKTNILNSISELGHYVIGFRGDAKNLFELQAWVTTSENKD